MKPTINQIQIKIYADGADKQGMLEMSTNKMIKGFTTNPTLMNKAGIKNYQAFALDILEAIPDKPISFEVFSDDFREMKRQALLIKSWGEQVYVKIPITNTHREPSSELIQELAKEGVKQNVTAIMTLEQVRDAAAALAHGPSSYISVFAGRIADTGRDPIPLMSRAVELLSAYPQLELIWASPRELLNVFQANKIHCPIITVTNDLIKKLVLVGKDLDEYSLDTVKMFYHDAHEAGYHL